MGMYVFERHQRYPITHTAKLLDNHWKIAMLWVISQEDGIRPRELRERIPGLSEGIRAKYILKLELNGLITRPKDPPTGSCHLTDAGKDLIPALKALNDWAITHPDVGLWVERTEEEKRANLKALNYGRNPSRVIL